MPCGSKETCLYFLRCHTGSGHFNIVYIQFGFGQLQDRSTERCDVILECDELQRDLLRFLYKSLQLLRDRLCRSNTVCLLAAVCHHLVYQFVQALGFDIHRLNDLRIGRIDLVITILIRAGAGIYQDLSVDLVQTERGALQLGKDLALRTKGRFQAQCMFAFGQINIIRNIVGIRQILAFPVVIIVKGDLAKFFERYLPVDQDRSGRNFASRIILTRLDHKIIITVCRHFEFPFNPHTVCTPCITADIIQFRRGNTARAGGR